MANFSNKSIGKLTTAEDDLQRLFQKVVEKYDCTILCGHRTKEEQEKAFNSGHSKVKYPNSRHNSVPSKAVDAAPYPIDWNDLDRFYHFAGYVRGIAESLGINIRWGGDWNGNFDLKDQNFYDLPHFEVVEL